jgi:SAM-dependent methyltransferase
MKRTIEKLAQGRREKEESFLRILERFREQAQALDRLRDDLQVLLKPPENIGPRLLLKKRLKTGNDFREFLGRAVKTTADLAASAAELFEAQSALADARDKEWDALGSNHVGIIFKSMEWRVDKLASAYEDARAVVETFCLLKDRLERLLAVLEEKRMPARADVQRILEPLEDWRYASFESRFRGAEDDVKKQQRLSASLFRPKSKVLDLGCGRGEFLELLRANGVQGYGVDLNDRMIERCLEKGLDCRKADILEALAEWPDGSLDGVFSSQVIEHLSPGYMKRMVELAFSKLTPGGIIVLETVNPVSVFAFVQIYNLDATHERPVHPEALRFLLESSGFADVEVRYSGDLSAEKLENLPPAGETAEVLNRNIDRLNDLLFAPPNYTATGKKK